mmetsp:Transcript_20010/g.28739  ORF Transcript_20010/g.28739 Transcript_20010/m.28739 type:complete len:222 (+) Transcript_20010:43-708(+)
MSSAATSEEHVVSRSHQLHDLYNVVTLPIVIISNVVTFYYFFVVGEPIESSTNIFWWNVQTAVLCTYIIIDTVYIALNPDCVRSPKSILIHHIVVCTGWLLVLHRIPKYRGVGTCLLSIEINTFFMIARKFLPFRKYRRLIKFLDTAFYATWVPLRIIIFPSGAIMSGVLAHQEYRATGIVISIPSVGFVLVSYIAVLNLKWSYDLLITKLYPKENSTYKK